jgi:hypothetical protein
MLIRKDERRTYIANVRFVVSETDRVLPENMAIVINDALISLPVYVMPPGLVASGGETETVFFVIVDGDTMSESGAPTEVYVKEQAEDLMKSLSSILNVTHCTIDTTPTLRTTMLPE